MSEGQSATTNTFEILPPASPPGIFGTKIPASVAFAIAILLFFMPFAEIKCNDSPVMNNSGFGIAVGSAWKATGSAELLGKDILGKSSTSTDDKEKKKSPNVYAIVALALGIIGLVLSLAVQTNTGFTGGIITGIISAVSLLLLMINLKNSSELKGSDTGIPKSGSGNTGLDTLDNMKLTIAFTPWFYIAIIAFLTGAFFCYKRMQINRSS